jgi:hypothetical protein
MFLERLLPKRNGLKEETTFCSIEWPRPFFSLLFIMCVCGILSC